MERGRQAQGRGGIGWGNFRKHPVRRRAGPRHGDENVGPERRCVWDVGEGPTQGGRVTVTGLLASEGGSTVQCDVLTKSLQCSCAYLEETGHVKLVPIVCQLEPLNENILSRIHRCYKNYLFIVKSC